jgi:hypothetical protein
MDNRFFHPARRVLPGLLLFLLLVVAPVAAYALIDVTTDPSSAYVCIDDWRCYYTPARFSVDAWSTHTISGSKAGYQYFTQTVRAGSDDSVSAEPVTLVPDASETGSLYIRSDPSGADLWVDSRYYGETPGTVGDLNPGSYDILLRKAGYLDHEESARVNAGRTTSVYGGLTPSTPDAGAGTLQVDSRPGGASVYLDDDYQGTTPSGGGSVNIRSLDPGSYALRLEMPDYQTYSDTVVINKNIITDIHAQLVPDSPGPQPDTTGQLTIDSEPAGADVLLDNQYKGITPVYLSDIPVGSHSLLLSLSGYQDYTTTATVVSGTTVNVPVTLNSLPETTAVPVTVVPTTAKAGLSALIPLLATGIFCSARMLKK